MIVSLGVAISCCSSASAADQLSGIVLMVPTSQTVVVHHGSFAGMPAMTMTFGVPASLHLRAGDRIRADVDRASDPWTLAHVHVLGSEMRAARATDVPFLRAGDRVPTVGFVDQTSRRFSLNMLAGEPYALTFAYTRCADPTMCPLISAKYQWLQRRMKKPVALVEISLDPAYDRPPVLAQYGARLGSDPSRWHLLTGDPRQVLDFASRFGILEHSAGPVSIVHSERLAIVGRDGRISRLFDGATWSLNDVLSILERA